jgi:Ni/Fe-hydrogenase 1 B-type cytochrome subunit
VVDALKRELAPVKGSVMTDSQSAFAAVERVYIWEAPVRLTHWVLFFSILILSVTGYYIGHPFISLPGPAKDHFVMGTMRVFSVAVLIRIYWMFAGNRYAGLSELLPLSGERWRNLWDSLLFFCFIRRDPAPYRGHDALAGATYGVLFLIYLILIVTGLSLYTAVASADSPFHVFGFLAPWFGGLQRARLIHHLCMYVVLIAAVIHIYCVFLWSMVERSGEVDSMFTGYKFFPTHKAGSR